MAYSVTMVVQFHDTFVTKSDRAYDVRCFYKERTVSVEAGTIDVGFVTRFVSDYLVSIKSMQSTTQLNHTMYA